MKSKLFFVTGLIVVIIVATIWIYSQRNRNQFKMTLDGEECLISAYRDDSSLEFGLKVQESLRSTHPWLLPILNRYTDISSYLSNDEIRKFNEFDLDDARIDLAREKMRADAISTENPNNSWHGFKYSIDVVFVVESQRGSFLLYTVGAKASGKPETEYNGCLKLVDGLWKYPTAKSTTKKFDVTQLMPVIKEFKRRHEAGEIIARPFSDIK